MSAAPTPINSSPTLIRSGGSVYTTPAFWERLWRSAGIQAVGLFVVGYVIYGHQPQIRASADSLAAFYNGTRTQILIAAVCYGFAIVNLMWFAAALRTTLADAGHDGWGAAATAASAAVGGLFLLLVGVVAVLAYSIAGSGNQGLTSGLNFLAWAGVVLSSFPRAMLIMSAAFGLWRAGLISSALFTVGVAALCSYCWARPRGWEMDYGRPTASIRVWFRLPSASFGPWS
jgi:hypothetical protein